MLGWLCTHFPGFEVRHAMPSRNTSGLDRQPSAESRDPGRRRRRCPELYFRRLAWIKKQRPHSFIGTNLYNVADAKAVVRTGEMYLKTIRGRRGLQVDHKSGFSRPGLTSNQDWINICGRGVGGRMSTSEVIFHRGGWWRCQETF